MTNFGVGGRSLLHSASGVAAPHGSGVLWIPHLLRDTITLVGTSLSLPHSGPRAVFRDLYGEKAVAVLRRIAARHEVMGDPKSTTSSCCLAWGQNSQTAASQGLARAGEAILTGG